MSSSRSRIILLFEPKASSCQSLHSQGVVGKDLWAEGWFIIFLRFQSRSCSRIYIVYVEYSENIFSIRQLCDCPQKKSLTAGDRIGQWIKFLFKSAIAAGFVYWTSSEGLWGDGRETEDLYYRMVETVAPRLPETPDLDNVNLLVASIRWTKIWVVVDCPEIIQKFPFSQFFI